MEKLQVKEIIKGMGSVKKVLNQLLLYRFNTGLLQLYNIAWSKGII